VNFTIHVLVSGRVRLPAHLYSTLILVIVIATALLVGTFLRH
jgi:hypothetical protein